MRIFVLIVSFFALLSHDYADASCALNNSTLILNQKNGLIEDGSPTMQKYLKHEFTCEWIIEPQNATYITLAIERFSSVFADDFLRVYKDDERSPDAVLTGEIFSHTRVFKNVTKLRVKFTSEAMNSERGFKIHYFSDGENGDDGEEIGSSSSCLNACDNGVGFCDERFNVCVCPKGRMSADCSVTLHQLVLGKNESGSDDGDGSAMIRDEGYSLLRSEPGSCAYLNIDVPMLDQQQQGNFFLRVEAQFPDGVEQGTKPSMFLSKVEQSNEELTFYVPSNGYCETEKNGCEWVTGTVETPNEDVIIITGDKGIASQSFSLLLSSAGKSGELVEEDNRNETNKFTVRVPQVPTFHYHNQFDYESWSLLSPLHNLFESNISSSGSLRFIVAVCNIATPSLPISFRNYQLSNKIPSTGDEDEEGEEIEDDEVSFWTQASNAPKADLISLVKVVISNETKDSCVTDCNGNRTRCAVDGDDNDIEKCSCERPFAGKYCESEMAIIAPNGIVKTFSETVDRGGSAKFYISIPSRPLDVNVNAVKIEIAHENNPSALGTVLIRRDKNVSSQYTDNRADRVVVCAAWPDEVAYHGETRCRSLRYFADYAANTDRASSQQDSQLINTLASVTANYVRLDIPIETVFEEAFNTMSTSAGYYVTVLNHQSVSGERMSFDARVSFEYEEYLNKTTSQIVPLKSCPFNCSGHGYCYQTLYSYGMCICFRGYAGLYCQNNATKLVSNGDPIEQTLAPGEWSYFSIESKDFASNASLAILSVQILNFNDVNGIPELFGKKVTTRMFANTTEVLFETPVPVQMIHSDFVNTSMFKLDSSLNVNTTFTSSGYIGDRNNSFLSFEEVFDIPMNASIIDISWRKLRIDAKPPSYVMEACLSARSSEENSYWAFSQCPSNTPASGTELVQDGKMKTPGLLQNGANAGIEFFESVDDDISSSSSSSTALTDANWLSGEFTVTWRAFVRTGYDVDSIAQTRCSRKDCVVPNFLYSNFSIGENENWSFGVRNAKIYQSDSEVESNGGTRFAGSDKDLKFRISLLTAESDIDKSRLCVGNCSNVGTCNNGVCLCPSNLTGVACSINIETLELVEKVVQRNFSSSSSSSFPTNFVIWENVTDVRVLTEGAFDVYKFQIPHSTVVVRATLAHALHHGSSPRLFLKRNSVPIYCPPGLRGGFLSDGSGKVAMNIHDEDGICRDSYDASDSLESRDESSSEIPESKVISNDTDHSSKHPSFHEDEKYLVQHEVKVKVADIPLVNFTNDDGDDDDALIDWWYLLTYNDPTGATENLLYRLSVQGLPFSGWCENECQNDGTCDEVMGTCSCGDSFTGTQCQHPLIVIESGETHTFEDRLQSGEAVVFSFEIRCLNQKFVFNVEKFNDYYFSSDAPELFFGISRGSVPRFDSKRDIWTNADIFETVANNDVGGQLGFSRAPPGVYFAIVAVDFGYRALLDGIKATLYVEGSDDESGGNETSQCLYPSGTLGIKLKTNLGELEQEEEIILDVFEIDYGNECGEKCYLSSKIGLESVSGNFVFPKSRPEQSSFTEPFYYFLNDARKYFGIAENTNTTNDESKEIEYQSPDPRNAIASNDYLPDAWDREGCNTYIGNARKGEICVVVRGSCSFAQKTINCQDAGGVGILIMNVDTYEGNFPAAAADNWRSFPPSTAITIPSFAIGQTFGDELLRLFSSPDSKDTTLEMFLYSCTLPFCQKCAFGLGDPATNCTTRRCPGLDATFSAACNGGRGVCNENFECDCIEGFEGESCTEFSDPPVFTSEPDSNKVLQLASNELATFFFAATSSSSSSVKFRVFRDLSDAATMATIDANTGNFVFDATKLLNNNNQNVTMNITVEAIDSRGQSSKVSFPITVKSAPNKVDTEIQRITNGFTVERKESFNANNGEDDVSKTADDVDENSLLPNTTDDDDTDDQNDFVLVKSFGFLFVVAFVSLVVIIFLALKLYKIRAKTIAQRRGNLLSRTIELSDDVETLRSRYQPS
jgi:hypothetical protein